MRTFHDLKEYRPSRRSAVAVGVFDGFHLGHRRIIQETVEAARGRDLDACVVTFRTHPRKVLAGRPQDLIASIEHRLALLERAGVDVALAVDFTPEIASLPAERFVAEVLAAALGARVLVLGPDARMGAGAVADAELIRKLAAGHGIEVRVVEPVLVEGEAVSSTRVRAAILEGDLAAAERLLGRRVSVLGTVVPGRGHGRRLGFPTANVDIHREVRPPSGVYATWAHFDGRRFPSATNVGFRPSFPAPERGLRPDLLVETHLFSPPRSEIYGAVMEIEFVAKLRDERRFGTDDELAEQIAHDVEAARAALDADLAKAGGGAP